MNPEKIRHYLTTYGVSFVFLTFGIWEIVNPQYWAVFVPPFISSFFNSGVNLVVQIHGIVLTLIGTFLVFEFKRKIFAVLGTLVMLEIIVSLYVGSGFSDLLVRDIAITLFVASLFFDDYK